MKKITICEQDEESPDSLEYFDINFKKATGMCMSEFKDVAIKVDSPDNDFIMYRYGHWTLDYYTDWPFWRLQLDSYTNWPFWRLQKEQS